MTRFVLHIGTAKTGTTALQAYLARNRRALLAAGTLYPDLRLWGLPLGLKNHNALSAEVAGRRSGIGITAEAAFDQLRDQAAKAGVQQVVLSAEGFTGHPDALLFDTEAAFREAEAAYIARLRALLDGAEVRVLVYLRRQDLWLESLANQRIKYAGTNSGPSFSTIEEFARGLAPRLDYRRSLSVWAATFGEDALMVRPYERPSLEGGSVITDALAQIGLAGFTGTDVPAGDLRAANTALSRDVLEWKIRLDQAEPGRRRRSEREFLADALREISAEMGGAVLPLMSPRQARDLLDTHATGNAEIARRWMKRPDGRLFTAPEPDGTEPPAAWHGLSPEVAAEIDARLAAKRASPQGRRRLRELRLAEAIQHQPQWLRACLRLVRDRLRGL
ncbi:MAG: hypothetical protein ACK4KW_07760 [Gemmobacter sp.]